MSGITLFFDKTKDSKTKKMLITQKNLKKCIKSFENIKKFNYNANV